MASSEKMMYIFDILLRIMLYFYFLNICLSGSNSERKIVTYLKKLGPIVSMKNFLAVDEKEELKLFGDKNNTLRYKEIYENINGASLIRLPDNIRNALGRYYLYFGHHQGHFIRLAYADNVYGPYKIYNKQILRMNDEIHHLASPDAHVLPNGEIALYFHSGSYEYRCQYTFLAFSSDGIDFKTDMRPLGSFYFRAFILGNTLYSISKSYDKVRDIEIESDTIFGDEEEHAIQSYAKLNFYPFEGVNNSDISFKVNRPFIPLVYFLPNARHTAVKVVNEEHIILFYTLIGEAPEQLYCADVFIEKVSYDEMESITWTSALNELSHSKLYREDPRTNEVSLNQNLHVYRHAVAPAVHKAFPVDKRSESLLKRIGVGVKMRIRNHQRIAYPEEEYEGADEEYSSSKRGAAKGLENALRDPAYFFDTETNKSFLLYSYGGEIGIALAEIKGPDF
jgi:hypothetical protein